ncbi:MAG: response regulator [Candidatus Limivivens sp.]|nr:response regulator [Candidatus Limivivens sp.]
MYKVLLVDDEALIREAISENIHWEELGYRLMASCKNGREAMEMIRQDPPDLLLTDINMPYIDGMELTRMVYEEYKDTKVVIISGYDEFEYAKQAVKYQVMEYILKPITPQEMTETLLRIREKLDERRTQEANIRKIQGAYNRNLPVLRGRFLNSLLLGKVDAKDILQKMEDYRVRLQGPSYMTAIVVTDDLQPFLQKSTEYKEDLGYFAIYNIADEIVKNYSCGETLQDVDESTVLIFQGDAGMEDMVLKVCEEIREAVKKFLNLECTMGIGLCVGSLEKLSESFADARKSLEFKFLLGNGQVIYAKNLLEKRSRQDLSIPRFSGQLVLDIKADNRSGINRDVQNFIQAVRENYGTRNRSIYYVQNLILSIMNSLDTSALNEDEIFSQEQALCNSIYQKEQLSEIAQELIRFCEGLAGSLHDEKDSYCKKQALIALDYIEKNYWDSQISLNSVCNYLAMSTSYFSSIFKTYTGETFIEALTKKRIEKAKSLLENTTKKTYEIAGEVGYSDPHYFSSAFKKMTGMTPTEYGKKVR